MATLILRDNAAVVMTKYGGRGGSCSCSLDHDSSTEHKLGWNRD